MSEHLLEALKARFMDCLNYKTEDPLAPIGPLTYRTPQANSCPHIAAIRVDRPGGTPVAGRNVITIMSLPAYPDGDAISNGSWYFVRTRAFRTMPKTPPAIILPLPRLQS
jgi:hypothetical protein